MNIGVGEELSKLKDPVGMRTNMGSVTYENLRDKN